MHPPVSQLKAVGLAVAAYSFWVLADASLKVTGYAHLPPLEVLAAWGLSTVLVIVLFCVAKGRTGDLWPRSPSRQLFRASMDLANNFCVIIALRHLPLELFYILVFLAPLVTSGLAAIFLREPLGWKQGAGILVGFAGVVIAVHPSGGIPPGELKGYLACMVCVLSFSIGIVFSRVITRTEHPESLTCFSGALLALVGGLGTFFGAQPVPLRLIPPLLLTGAFGVAGSLCFFTAIRHTSAANVSQYHYSQLVTGALLAFFVFGEKPTAAMLAGAALIIGAGLYTASLAGSHRDTTPT